MSIVKHKATGFVVLLLLLAVGTLLRGHKAASMQLAEDEAESSINAQSILQNGVPTDSFLGQPVFENVMLRTWPEHEEYEFKDLSYSDKGVAVYHGWLPLYSIAGSMKLFGQVPDVRSGSLTPTHKTDSLLRRTVVPRLPAIVLAVVFMYFLYALGRRFGGPAAGWSALMFAAVAKKNVYYGSQARYYSLTLVLIAGCGWVLWRIIRYGRWRDYLLGSVFWVLLFHTHVTSCLGMCVMAVVSLPWHRRAKRLWIKRVTAFLIVAVGTLPWVWWTGYLQHTSVIPLARRMDGFGAALLAYATQRPVELTLFFLGITAAVLAWVFAERMPRRMVEAFGARRGVYALVATWAGVMFLSYVLCMPAASFFLTRLSLMIAVPCILLASMILAGAAHMVSRRWAHLIAPAAVLVLLASTGRLIDNDAIRSYDHPFNDIRVVIDYLDDADLSDDTRLYATPNTHLILTYYTGLPIQSIAPIRKTYLDNYPGPIVIFQRAYFAVAPDIDQLRALVEAEGEALDEPALHVLAERIQTREYRKEIASKVASVHPPLEPVPAYLEPVYEAQRQALEVVRDMISWRMSSLMFYGFTIRTSPQWWQTYKYRFVDPASRSGDNLNYAHRARSAVAVALPRARYFVLHCPPLEAGD